MLLKCFNCTKCDKPFDCKEGMPNTPIAVSTECVGCNANTVPAWGLMKFLDQPAFTKTGDCYLYNGDLTLPECAKCKLSVMTADSPNVLPCGHLFCFTCLQKLEKCAECNAEKVKGSWFKVLMTFLDLIYKDSIAKKREEVAIQKTISLKCCTDCEIEQTVERLFNCIDCTTLICGVCYFHRHREHSVAPQLGIELTKLKADARNRHDDKLNGLQKNLKFLHQEVEQSITDVITIGQNRLHEIDGQKQFSMARRIASEVDSATDEFEKCFEEYVPVARVFNEKLTQLGEKLQSARAE